MFIGIWKKRLKLIFILDVLRVSSGLFHLKRYKIREKLFCFLTCHFLKSCIIFFVFWYCVAFWWSLKSYIYISVRKMFLLFPLFLFSQTHVPTQMISPSLRSQLTQRRLLHCGETMWLWAALRPAAVIHQWPQPGGRMGRCCMMQKWKIMPGTKRESWSIPLCFTSSMWTSPMRGVTSVWSPITLVPITPTGPSLLSMVRMCYLFKWTWSVIASSFLVCLFFGRFLRLVHLPCLGFGLLVLPIHCNISAWSWYLYIVYLLSSIATHLTVQ